MRRLIQSVSVFVVAAVLMGAAAFAADRTVTVLKDTDLPGFDYQVDKSVTLQQCQQACVGDNICHAFTYNSKAKWCFLKADVAKPATVAGATSGTIALSPPPEDLAKTRIADIPFPAEDMIASARDFATNLPNTDAPPKDLTYADLVKSGDDGVAQANNPAAALSYRQALALNGNDPATWLKLANVMLAQADDQFTQNNQSAMYDMGATASYAALNGFLKSEAVEQRAPLLGALAHALERREMWRESIQTYRASIALVDNADLQARLDDVVAQHGFRITSNNVDAEGADPRICVTFSDPLPLTGTDMANYVVVDGVSKISVDTEQTQICITGIDHGKRYHLTFRAGLPSADNETLKKDAPLDVYVPDRTPFVGFANNAYVLPAGLGGGLPITSVNAESADVKIFRIGDRSIATAVRNGVFAGNLTGYSAEDVANQYGEQIWTGTLDLAKGKPNEMSTTAVPVNDALPKMEPGAYVITARVSKSKQDYWQDLATQWFVVTDLGLTTVSGTDGVHVFVRSLTTAQPIVGSKVRLVAVNNEVLGEASTDANGEATFAAGLARGDGGRAPQLLVAETDGGDYSFLDVSKSPFDLTDRGVAGRQSPGPLDLFMTTERGVYRPGETVFTTALVRDQKVKAVTGLPITMQVERPDGVLASTTVLKDQGEGSYFSAMPLLKDAMRGAWTIRMYADPQEAALSSTTFLVEDFEPERLAFDIKGPEGAIKTGEVTNIDVAAKYLYGATAPGLSIEADSIVRPTTTLDKFPGYTFGREDDTTEADSEPLGVVGTTDENGNATAEVTVPAPSPSTRPLVAQIVLRLVDTNGRTVERSLSRPVMADGPRIGVKAQFEGSGLAQGAAATFDIITQAPEGDLVATSGLKWTLSKIDTNYQWYRDNGTWKWEDITTTREVANGSVDTTAAGPATISSPVDWGRYQLEVTSEGDTPTSTTYTFYAGYYYADAGSNTPDTLQVALDKDSYKVGDTVHLRLDPQFAGTALVMVVDDRIIDMKAVDVPAGGTTVDLPVTGEWGPGAYVTATLYRPSSAAEKRMPARALGLSYADVDPGDLKLDVKLDAPKEAKPRTAFSTKITLANAKPGEKAYVAVAAVDLGILNLTKFEPPDPDGWFFGQRQLGVEFRDLYGSLIDPTQGLMGALRSGGDEANSRLGTPPATTVLVALHTGVVEVAADGTVTVNFDMPDFAGTVRVMAMAWTDTAVGHASTDVVVHDPVVTTLSPPRFLRLNDSSRLLVEINNVSGPAGSFKVELDPGEGLATDAPATNVDLATGARTALNLGLTGKLLGDQTLKLIITQPDGVQQVKELTLGVRASSGAQTVSEMIALEPGQSVTLDKSKFAGLIAHTSELSLAIGPIARLDVPLLLDRLDRYPYGCAEQVSSRAMPLLYLNDVAVSLGMASDAALDQRLKDAIADLLTHQTSTGGFGLWGPFDQSDLWLDSYVTDFLLRAKEKGYTISAQAMTNALDNLSNQVSYAADFDKGGEEIAYALYDMARAGRAAIGDLRYYVEAKLDNFGSPLAKAQLGAALALYGDRTRAATAFNAAIEGLSTPDDPKRWRTDYGSQLRDTAAVLALVAEFPPAGVDVSGIAKKLADLRDHQKWTSTQEDAWTLLAAAALEKSATSGSVTIDGKALSGTVYQHYQQEHFDSAPVVVANTGNQPTEMKVSVTGIPETPPKASSNGFTIKRTFYNPDGTDADMANVHQNQRFVVQLQMTETELGSGQYVVSDPIPAGFEIENPDLSSSGGVADLSWLTVNAPTHVEARTDQYVAAFRYVTDTASFSTAYMVRAVSPGKFVMPGATIEDMYRPELRANTDAGTVEVLPPGGETAAPAKTAAPAPAAPAVDATTAAADMSAPPVGTITRKVTSVQVKPDGTIVGVD